MSQVVSGTGRGRPAITSALSAGAAGLVWCGVVASPIWLVIVLAQMLLHEGFDIRRQAISVLLLGDYGWIQVLNYVVVGLLIAAGAAGLRKAMRPGPAGRWGPVVLAMFGLALIAAAFFPPDAADGFAPVAPSGNVPFSIHGALHAVFSSMSFLSFAIASTFVFPRRFLAQRQRGHLLDRVGGTLFRGLGGAVRDRLAQPGDQCDLRIGRLVRVAVARGRASAYP